MKDLISVIVPVYNVADYLPQCLDSILRQDHGNLEVILIDDGSTDESPEICDRYGAADSRVRVIHQKNGGAAAAKNAGLRIAAGEYLAFADSDDYLEPGAYSHMLRVLKETGAQAGEFAFRYVSRSGCQDHVVHQGREILPVRDYLRRFTQSWTCALLWNKLYRRELFDGIFFEEGHRIDDEYFTYQGIMYAETVVCDAYIVYNYRLRASGAMLNPMAGEQRMLDRVDFMNKRRIRVASRFPELKREFDVEYLDALVYFTEYPENTDKSLKAIQRAIAAYCMHPGNTFPPKHLWRGLLRAYLTNVDTLLQRCRENRKIADQSDYFA